MHATLSAPEYSRRLLASWTMALRLCLSCATVEGASTCATCGGPLVSPSKENLKALLDAKVRVEIDAWERAGVVDAETSERLRERRKGPATKAVEPTSKRSSAKPVRDVMGAVLDGLERRKRETGERWNAIVARVESDGPTASKETSVDPAPEPRRSSRNKGSGGDTRDAIDAGRGLFGGAEAGAGGGLEALADLDDAPSSSRAPGDAAEPHHASAGALLAEYVWWFLGMLLVLAGSVMGVREAWRTLAGPPRQIVIAAALFGYHGMFLGLSALVARRSTLAGRVLASIAVGLLPTVFIALAALAEGSRGLGLGVSAGALALTALTLSSAEKRFSNSPSRTLALVVIPALAAEVLVGSATTLGLRMAIPFVGIASAGYTGLRLGRSPSMASSVAAFVASTYVAIALGLFAILGAPGSSAFPIESGSLAHAAVLLYFLALALVLAHAAGKDSVVRAAPHLAPAVELGALAGVALASCVAARAAFVEGSSFVSDAPLAVRGTAAFAFGALPAMGAIGFAVAAKRHSAALHPAVLLGTLSTFLLARAAFPGQASMAFAGAALAGALVVLASRFSKDRVRTMLEVWGGGIGLLATAFAGASSTRPAGEPVLECVVAGGIVAAAAHAAGGIHRGRMHVVGTLAALGATAAFFVPSTPSESTTRLVYVCAALAAGYGLLALPHGARLARREHDLGERPLDDMSLVFGLVGGLVFVFRPFVLIDLASATYGQSFLAAARLLAPVVLPGLAVSAAIAARAVRDRSRLVPFAAALVVGATLSAGLGVSGGAGLALAMGLATVVATVAACARGPQKEPERASSEVSIGRPFAAIFPIPFGATGSDLMDGVAAAAMAFAGRGVVATLEWLSVRPEEQRIVAVLGLSLMAGALVLAFVSHSHRAFALRGSVGTLGALGAFAAFAGVTNRIGRPLPPAVVGVRLSILIALIWLLARLLTRTGPKLATWLGRPDHGPRYAFVPHVGVFVLGALLAVDAVLVGGPTFTRALLVTPPSFFLGAALSAFLLARSSSRSVLAIPLVYTGLGALLLAAPLVAVRRSLLGPVLVPLVPPGSQWVLVGTEEAARPNWLDPLGYLPASETVVALYSRAYFGLLVFAIASLALTAFLARSALARRVVVKGLLDLDPDSDTAKVANGAFAATACAAGLGGFAAFAQPALDVPAVPGLFVALALALFGAGARRELGAAKVLTAAAVVTAGVAAFVGTACAFERLGSSVLTSPSRVAFSSLDLGTAVSAFGPALALALAFISSLAHVGTVASESKREAHSWGLAAGRDVLLVGTLVLLAWTVGTTGTVGTTATVVGASTLRAPLGAGALALVLVAGTALHALVRGRTPRHAYVLQVSIVAAYALIRVAIPTLPPFLDAIAALIYGFVLVGATTLATRLEVPPVAAATRRFAAALPLLVAVLRADGASLDSALIAAGAGVLYAVLAATDKSRIFGAFAAIAGNLALLLGALALGFDGIEAYVGPLGLLLLVLAQIFAAKLTPQSRMALRILGSLLLYAPAAMKLTFRLGQATDGTYSVLFGAVCILGMLAGMALRIRAYVVIGTLFVTLDVVANLVFAGLRDHRVGFVILSVSGLAILATMIAMTLKREEVTAFVRRVRGAVRGWD